MTTIVQSNKKKRTESTLEIIRLKKKKEFSRLANVQRSHLVYSATNLLI